VFQWGISDEDIMRRALISICLVTMLTACSIKPSTPGAVLATEGPSIMTMTATLAATPTPPKASTMTPIRPVTPTGTQPQSATHTSTLSPSATTAAIPTQPTATPIPTLTVVPTVAPTLEPQQAAAALMKLLQTPQCRAPCFWGVTPEQTTIADAQKLFGHVGLPLQRFTVGGIDYYSAQYKFESGLSIGVSMPAQDLYVATVTVDIGPEIPQSARATREWLAYSPETLIQQYGPPSRVDISIASSHDVGAKLNFQYLLAMYFDAPNLIIDYESAYDFVKPDPATGRFRVCPVTDQFRAIRIWFGKYPNNRYCRTRTGETGSRTEGGVDLGHEQTRPARRPASRQTC
jgi:hypothetical protein